MKAACRAPKGLLTHPGAQIHQEGQGSAGPTVVSSSKQGSLEGVHAGT
jgi:hypothetical protein